MTEGGHSREEFLSGGMLAAWCNRYGLLVSGDDEVDDDAVIDARALELGECLWAVYRAWCFCLLAWVSPNFAGLRKELGEVHAKLETFLEAWQGLSLSSQWSIGCAGTDFGDSIPRLIRRRLNPAGLPGGSSATLDTGLLLLNAGLLKFRVAKAIERVSTPQARDGAPPYREAEKRLVGAVFCVFLLALPESYDDARECVNDGAEFVRAVLKGLRETKWLPARPPVMREADVRDVLRKMLRDHGSPGEFNRAHAARVLADILTD